LSSVFELFLKNIFGADFWLYIIAVCEDSSLPLPGCHRLVVLHPSAYGGILGYRRTHRRTQNEPIGAPRRTLRRISAHTKRIGASPYVFGGVKSGFYSCSYQEDIINVDYVLISTLRLLLKSNG